MSAGTLRLSERSKSIYAKRCGHQPRLLDVRMSYGSSVRAFKRLRRKLLALGTDAAPGAVHPKG